MVEPLAAKVVKFEVVKIESPAFEGRSFGTVGTYDRITARATIAVSPGETAAFGFVGTRPVLLMPGRLDSALAIWLLIGRHIIAKLSGGRVELDAVPLGHLPATRGLVLLTAGPLSPRAT